MMAVAGPDLAGREVSADVVVREFRRRHPLRHPRNLLAWHYVRRATRQLGRWTEVWLSSDDLIRCVVLPWHRHDFLRFWRRDRGPDLVPPGGLPLPDAVRRLRGLADYPQTAPTCYRILQRCAGQPLEVLFLARGHSVFYSSVFSPPGWADRLVPLDGVHRLIAHFGFQSPLTGSVRCFVASRTGSRRREESGGE